LALIVPLFVFGFQAFADGGRFTPASLSGTYYIPCACEGMTPEGVPVYTGGMGEVFFDGHGNLTLTQRNVYVQQNGTFQRLVADGFMLDPNTGLLTVYPAQRQGTYSVDSDGYGKIVWEGQSPDDCDPTVTPNSMCPSLMITAADGKKATAVYLVIPDGVPNILIHVTASKR
jgi:hypothetical protein